MDLKIQRLVTSDELKDDKVKKFSKKKRNSQSSPDDADSASKNKATLFSSLNNEYATNPSLESPISINHSHAPYQHSLYQTLLYTKLHTLLKGTTESI